MNPLMQSSLVGAVFVTAIAISVALRSEGTRREKRFLSLTISLALIYTLYFLYLWNRGEVFFRLFVLGALLVPIMLLEFFRAFIGSGEKERSRFAIFLRIIAGVLAICLVPPLLPRQICGIITVIFTGIMSYFSIYYLFKKSRKVQSKVESTRIIYLVIGGIIAVTFSLTDLLILINISFLPIGSLLVSIYLFLLAQAIFSQRLMDLYELFGRMAVLGSLALTIAGIFSVLTLFEMASASYFVNAMAAAFVMLIIFDPLREKVEQKIGQFFLKEMSDFINSIEETKRNIARAFELEGISSTLMEGLKKSGRFTSACFYVIGEHEAKFILKGFFGQKVPEEINIAAIRSLIDKMEKEGAIFGDDIGKKLKQLKDRGTQERDEKESNGEEWLLNVLSILNDIKSDAVIPVKESGTIYGFIGVRDERMKPAFSTEDIKRLESLAGHVAIAIENTRLYDKIKERDRLAAIGEMSAGLAHEIRNPLGSIKGAVQFIMSEDKLVQKNEEEKEFLDIIISEVDRLNKIVTSFLDYARPSHTKDEYVVSNVNSVILQMKKVVEGDASTNNVDIEFNLAREELKSAISEDKLGQVIWNLLINAIEASSENGVRRGKVVLTSKKVDLNTGWKSLYTKQAQDTFVEIDIADNGPGIPPNVLPKIFIPFFTTKPKGTGLGLAISHRIVRECGGFMEVDSKEGEGTTFKVFLPNL